MFHEYNELERIFHLIYFSKAISFLNSPLFKHIINSFRHQHMTVTNEILLKLKCHILILP